MAAAVPSGHVAPDQEVLASVARFMVAVCRLAPSKRAPVAFAGASEMVVKDVDGNWVSPLKLALTRLVFARFAPVRFAPARSALAKLSPERSAPAKLSPARFAPGPTTIVSTLDQSVGSEAG